MSHEAVETIQAICSVSTERAAELLEAASGSTERAIEIHFDHQTAPSHSEKTPTHTPRKHPSNLDAFLGKSTSSATSKTNHKKSPVHTLDAFFSPRQKRSKTEPPTAVLDLSNQSTLEAADTDEEKLIQDKPALPTPDAVTYAILAKALAEMIATTKRSIKTNVLVELFKDIIESVGGIHKAVNREQDALVLVQTIDLILGKLSSSHGDDTGTVLQVSGSAVSAAVQTVTGVSRPELSKAYRNSGDLGDVAASLFVSNRQKQFFGFAKQQSPLSIAHVHQQLKAIANVSAGKGSQKERLGLMVKLMRRASDKEELRFLVRLLLGNMRLGATIKTIIVALATAVEQVRQTQPDFDALPDPLKSLEQVFNICPRLGKIATSLLMGGIPFAMTHCSIEIGCPIQPMLADPVHSFTEIQAFLTASNGAPLNAVAEYKYDGVRCQAHWDGSTMRLFSRNMLESTPQYPDAVKYMIESMSDDVASFIIDSEIVAVVQDAKCSNCYRLLPFQDLATRRGTKASESSSTVSIRVFAFDLMSLNGRSLLYVTLAERQRLLRQHFRTSSNFAFAESTELVGYQETELQLTLQRAIDEGAEGLMLKLTGSEALPTAYDSGNRSKTWKKVKKDYLGGFADTIDVVPIGAWFGNGRKAQKGFLSPVLLAVYDENEGVYRSIARCMSFSDAMYSAMRDFYFRGVPYPTSVGLESSAPLEVTPEEGPEDVEKVEALSTEPGKDEELAECDEHSPAAVSDVAEDRVNCFPCRPSSAVIITNESPPIWFKPSEVFEVSFADLSLSKTHTAAAGLIDDEQNRGIALRFPRFKRRRPDKLIEQATTCSDIARLFGQQSKVKGYGD